MPEIVKVLVLTKFRRALVIKKKSTLYDLITKKAAVNNANRQTVNLIR